MNEKLKKETPIPSRLRGRGVEVSKTLFYGLQQTNLGKICRKVGRADCGMIFQTGSGIYGMVTEYHKNVCIIYSSVYTFLTFYVQNCQKR